MGRPETTLSALYCVHNEEQFIFGSIKLILPYVDEIIFINNGSTDNTRKIVEEINSDKIKIYDYPYKEPVDMGAVRTFSHQKCTSGWFIQVDADEYYPPESMEIIRGAIENAGDNISFRVGYYNLAWRHGYAEDGFPHYPDRIYRTDVVEKYEGILPVDMTYVKKEFLDAPVKSKGNVGILEYDNLEDESREHPRQKILPAFFYHLARSRGYNYEYHKWRKYLKNLSPQDKEVRIEAMARGNGWVNGKYQMKPVILPEYINPNNIRDPKLSVIITNYNYGEWVEEAIKSVLDQTVKPFEVIVVDDKSTDDSVVRIKKYPVTLIAKPENEGVAKARNEGIGKSTGDYYLLLDADDKLKPDFIEKVLPLMKNAQVAYANMTTFGATNTIHKYPPYSKQAMLEWQQIPSVCAIVDRHVWEEVGGFSDDFIYEDWAFWLAVSEKDYVFAQHDEPLFMYRIHEGGRCKQNDLHQVTGFNQLRERFGITRQPDKDKQNNI